MFGRQENVFVYVSVTMCLCMCVCVCVCFGFKYPFIDNVKMDEVYVSRGELGWGGAGGRHTTRACFWAREGANRLLVGVRVTTRRI